MNYNNLLILEQSKVELSTIDKQGKEYILEGIFGELDVTNRNGRKYTADQYLPQVKELQEKIKTSKLLGELDHPKNFDISLKNVSHVIEDLYYEEGSKQIKGRIRLLDTDAGRQAKALVDAGVPLHISSRAAGSVRENGIVEMKKLFTYDLVAEPGFANAELARVNESYGFENDDNFGLFSINAPIPGIDNIETNDRYTTNENKNNKMSDLITVENFEKYTKHIASQINEIKSKLSDYNSVKESTEHSSNLKGYVGVMRDKINDIYEYVNGVVEKLNTVIEQVEGIKGHNEHLTEKIKENREFANMLSQFNEDTIKYVESNAKKTNKILEYVEQVGQHAENNSRYSESLGQHVENLAKFGDELAEGINNLASYSEVLRGKLETVGQYSDYNSQNIGKLKEKVYGTSGNNVSKNTNVNESVNHKVENTNTIEESFDNDSYKSEIVGKLDLLIESAKKQTADFDGDLHFLRFLNDREKANYFALNESVKAQVIEKTKSKAYTSREEVNMIIESVISPTDDTPLFIKEMPKEYRDSWKNASESKQRQIIAESTSYSLNTTYQIDNFWSTRDFREAGSNFQPINENQNVESYKTTPQDNYLKWFEQELAQKFQR